MRHESYNECKKENGKPKRKSHHNHNDTLIDFSFCFSTFQFNADVHLKLNFSMRVRGKVKVFWSHALIQHHKKYHICIPLHIALHSSWYDTINSKSIAWPSVLLAEGVKLVTHSVCLFDSSSSFSSFGSFLFHFCLMIFLDPFLFGIAQRRKLSLEKKTKSKWKLAPIFLIKIYLLIFFFISVSTSNTMKLLIGNLFMIRTISGNITQQNIKTASIQSNHRSPDRANWMRSNLFYLRSVNFPNSHSHYALTYHIELKICSESPQFTLNKMVNQQLDRIQIKVEEEIVFCFAFLRYIW